MDVPLAERLPVRVAQLLDVDDITAENVFENLNAQFGGKTEERGIEGIFATPVLGSVVSQLDLQK